MADPACACMLHNYLDALHRDKQGNRSRDRDYGPQVEASRRCDERALGLLRRCFESIVSMDDVGARRVAIENFLDVALSAIQEFGGFEQIMDHLGDASHLLVVGMKTLSLSLGETLVRADLASELRAALGFDGWPLTWALLYQSNPLHIAAQHGCCSVLKWVLQDFPRSLREPDMEPAREDYQRLVDAHLLGEKSSRQRSHTAQNVDHDHDQCAGETPLLAALASPMCADPTRTVELLLAAKADVDRDHTSRWRVLLDPEKHSTGLCALLLRSSSTSASCAHGIEMQFAVACAISQSDVPALTQALAVEPRMVWRKYGLEDNRYQPHDNTLLRVLDDMMLRNDQMATMALLRALLAPAAHFPRDMPVGTTGETLLHRAAEFNRAAMATMLVDAQASLSAVTSAGDTALHVAARASSDSVVEELLTDVTAVQGVLACVALKNAAGLTPLQCIDNSKKSSSAQRAKALRKMLAQDQMAKRAAAAQPKPQTTKPAPSKQKTELKRDERVLISGLHGRPDLNGTHGVILSFEPEKGRFAVQLPTNESILLKPEHLAVVSPPSSKPSSPGQMSSNLPQRRAVHVAEVTEQAGEALGSTTMTSGATVKPAESSLARTKPPEARLGELHASITSGSVATLRSALAASLAATSRGAAPSANAAVTASASRSKPRPAPAPPAVVAAGSSLCDPEPSREIPAEPVRPDPMEIDAIAMRLEQQPPPEEAAGMRRDGTTEPNASFNFEDCAWRIVIVRNAAKQLNALEGADCRAALSKLHALAEGYWQDCTVAKKLLSHVASAKLSLYESKFLKGARIIWEVGVDFSPTVGMYTQTIRVWAVERTHDGAARAIAYVINVYRRGLESVTKSKLREAGNRESGRELQAPRVHRAHGSQITLPRCYERIPENLIHGQVPLESIESIEELEQAGEAAGETEVPTPGAEHVRYPPAVAQEDAFNLVKFCAPLRSELR